jgi:sulfatase maturation enzyme AslB (radical SAM superfamily)
MKGDEVRKINGRFESKYLNDSESVFSALNEVSPSFCLAKWFNVSIHIPTGRTHSCYHPPTHQIPPLEVAVDVSALHNTSWKKIQRKDMLEGKRPSECSFCWQIEDSGTQLSDRAYRSKDVYEPGLIEEALELGWQGDARPRYVEVNFNQACNFKCSYCSPHLSTEWNKEVDRLGPYKLSKGNHNDTQWMRNQNMVPNNSLDNPYLLAFWEWLPDIYPTLQTFRMTGGEPLMDKNTFRMFDYIKEHPHPRLQLSITSNCNPPGEQWSKFLTSLKQVTDADAVDHFMLFCSLDSWGSQAEYIRNGLDFCTLYTNVTEYLQVSRKHSLTFIITFNALSYTGFVKYIKNIHKLRQDYNTDRQLIWFDIPMLNDPMWLNPKLLPDMVTHLEEAIDYMNANKEGVFNRFKGFKDFEISKVQRLIDWIKSDTGFDRNKAMKDFYLFFSQHDERRGTNFLNTFPELTDFWIECEKT